jgi:hypothetical protein
LTKELTKAENDAEEVVDQPVEKDAELQDHRNAVWQDRDKVETGDQVERADN